MKIVALTPNGKHDYLTANVIEGLRELDCQIFASDIGNGIESACSDEQIIEHARDADYIVVFFGKVRDNRPVKRYLLDRMGDVKHKLLYVEDSEWTCTAHPEPGQVKAAKTDPARRRGSPWLDEDMLRRCNWYFKHSCYDEDVARGVIPFQIGVTASTVLPSRPKDIDLLCSFGQTNDGLRSEVLGVCRELEQNAQFKIVTASGMPKHEYLEVLSRSRIVIDAWGGSENNARFWEAVANGACVLHQRYTTIMMRPFLDYVDAVSYSDVREFRERVAKLLEHRELSIQIGDAARSTALAHHTARARAQYLVDYLKESKR